MKMFKLKAVVYPMLMAGGLQAGLSLPAMASGWAPNLNPAWTNEGNRFAPATAYRPAAFQQPVSPVPALPIDVSGYRFRPLSERQVERRVIKVDELAYRPAHLPMRYQGRPLPKILAPRIMARPSTAAMPMPLSIPMAMGMPTGMPLAMPMSMPTSIPVPMPAPMQAPTFAANMIPPPILPGLTTLQRATHYDRRTPAFMRQYAWSTAQPRGFRRGGEDSRYANQNNTETMVSAAPEFRTAPVTTQGYRFRNPTRNARFVTFSQRVKAALPTDNQLTVSQPVMPVAIPAAMPPVMPSAIPAAISTTLPAMPPMAKSTLPVTRHTAPRMASQITPPAFIQPGKALVESGNFRFRPVGEVAAVASAPALAPNAKALPAMPPVIAKATPTSIETAMTKAAAPMPAKPAALMPVSYQAPAVVDRVDAAEPKVTVTVVDHGDQPFALADVQMIKSGDNPWSDWSFRPVDSTF